MTLEPWLVRLRTSGCRLTGPRRAVVQVMQSAERPLTPLEVFDLGRRINPRLGLVTVYRTLDKLEALGLVQRVHQARSCQAFLRAGQGHQHILLCEGCGRAVLFEGDRLEALFRRIGQETGFDIRDHWLQVSGVCEACQTDGRTDC